MIAFLSHEASRTGAPIMFLHFLRWFKANHKEPFLIIIKKDGVITEDFKKHGNTYVIYKKINNLWLYRINKVFEPALLYIKLNILVLILKIEKNGLLSMKNR